MEQDRRWKAVPRRLAVAALGLALHAPCATAGLAEFIAKPDPSYRYVTGPTWQDGEVTVTEVQLTSQTFQGTAWTHVLAIVRPRDLVVNHHALLLVGGGRNDQLAPFGKAPGQTSPADLATLRDLAVRSRMLVAMIEQVPNQPLFGAKMEDETIAYTFTQFFKTGDDSWPLLEPMVKSVVRAIDAVQEVAAKNWQQKLTGFTLTGTSKRGWTSWLTAAVEPRVKAVAPMVFNMLNIKDQLPHQLRSWGTYSEQLGDYSAQGLPQMLTTAAGAKLLAVIDPYAYREHLTQTKLVVLATNDRYWPVDAASLYYDELQGPKYLLYVPNGDHEAKTQAMQDDRVTLALAAAGLVHLPKVEARFALGDGLGKAAIAIDSDVLPKYVKLWQAGAPSRDFRQAKWQATKTLAPQAKMAIPLTGYKKKWTAAFVELGYDLNGYPFTISSSLGLIPKS